MPDYADTVFELSSSLLSSSRDALRASVNLVKDTFKDTLGDRLPQQEPPQQTQRVPARALELTRHAAQYLAQHRLRSVLFVSSVCLYQGYRYYRAVRPVRRRAAVLPSGKRFEVVLIAGSPGSVVVQKLVNDLNRRGYIVFVTVTNENEVRIVENERDADIRPLLLNFESHAAIKNSLLRLAAFLDSPDKEDGHFYHFRGCIVVPDYFHFPKCARMSELNDREFAKMVDSYFFRLNSLLHDGVLSFIRESDQRRNEVEQYNQVVLSGGKAKLVFLNFVPISNRENRKLMLNLSLDMNRLLYTNIYRENRGFVPWSSVADDSINMTLLTVSFYKDDESKLLPKSSGILSFWQSYTQNKKFNTRKVHHKVFDLLNSNFLWRNYTLNT